MDKRAGMTFCTAVNCMDGRTQPQVIEFLRNRFQARYVDLVTEPGPNLILAKQTNLTLVRSLLDRIDISVHHHRSRGIAVAGHTDCAGNPAAEKDQWRHLQDAVAFLKPRYPGVEVIALWVDAHWQVREVALPFPRA